MIKIVIALAGALALSSSLYLSERAARKESEVALRGEWLCIDGVKVDKGQQITTHCHIAILSIYDRAKAAETCETALLAGDLSPSCTPSVQALYVSAEALKTQIDTLRADQDAAISRAEARGQSTVLRKYQNDAALKVAPVADDGLIVCDADCLRQRAQAIARP